MLVVSYCSGYHERYHTWKCQDKKHKGPFIYVLVIRTVVSYCSGYHEKTIESPFVNVFIRKLSCW